MNMMFREKEIFVCMPLQWRLLFVQPLRLHDNFSSNLSCTANPPLKDHFPGLLHIQFLTRLSTNSQDDDFSQNIRCEATLPRDADFSTAWLLHSTSWEDYAVLR